MPYTLQKSGAGFKVFVHGRPLSHHPLSHAMAERQQTAVQLSELRKEGRIPRR